MNIVERTEAALKRARRLGYHVRHEWLGGEGGGACEFGGRKWIFIDLALSSREQLEQVLKALPEDPVRETMRESPKSRQTTQTPKAA